jgi:grpE
MKKDKIVDKLECEDSETPETELEQDIEANEEVELPEEEESVDLEFLKAENQRLKEDFLRAYADAENIKKRCAQEIEKNNKYAISSFAKSLLSVADNLHRAIEAIPADKKAGCAEAQGLLKGVELTEAELMKVFDKFGVHKMEILNTVFDPNYHQVIQEVEDPDKPAGTIVSELQTGYMINDRILREAMVVVTKGGPTEH